MSEYLSYIRLPVIGSTVVACLASSLLYFKQNELIYPRAIPPDARTNVPKPSQVGLTNFEDLLIPTPDGESLSCFLIKPSNRNFARNVTILFFHGNAGNIGHRVPIAKILTEELGCNVLMLQYRGYGLSTGTPNEKGITIDAQTGLDYIRHRADLRDSKIVIYGQSLGGAVGIGLAANNFPSGDIAGIILENTFTSIRKMIPSAFPPARYLAPLCHQIWPSDEVIGTIKDVPFLFLSGLRDEIVPPAQMKTLYDLCTVPVKIWKAFPGGSHNDTVTEEGYFNAIDDFVLEEILGKIREGRQETVPSN